MDKKIALVSLELNEEEFGRFYNALHRAVYGAKQETIDKFAFQDSKIMIEALHELGKVISHAAIIDGEIIEKHVCRDENND